MITDKELQSVSSMGAFDRYRYFIKKIADAEKLWLLKTPIGEFSLSQIEGNTLLSVWSSSEYIKSCMNEEWANYDMVALTIEEFKDNVLPILKDRKYIIDVFPVNNKAGFVVTTDEFMYDLNNELSNY